MPQVPVRCDPAVQYLCAGLCCHLESCLLERLEFPDWETYRQWYDASLAEVLRAGLFGERQPFWSHSLTVGDADWVGRSATANGMTRYDVVDANETWRDGVRAGFVRAIKIS